MSTLLELYLGNNKVSDMREVLQLRTLPKLIILDLSVSGGVPFVCHVEARS